MFGKEQIPQPLGFRLLPQVVNDGGCTPSRLALFQLGLVDAFSRDAFRLNPVVNPLYLFNCDWAELGFHPWRYTRERWAAVHVNIRGHGEKVSACTVYLSQLLFRLVRPEMESGHEDEDCMHGDNKHDSSRLTAWCRAC